MKCLIFTLISLFTVFAQAQVQVHHVDSRGREWKRLDTTIGLDLNFLNSTCQPVCADGSVLQGYTWANQQQVEELMGDFSPVIPAQGVEGFFAASEFIGRLGSTFSIFATYQTAEFALGATTDQNEAGEQIYGAASYSHSGAGVTAAGSLGLTTVASDSTIPRGAFLFKSANVPPPPPPVTCQYNNQSYSVGQTVTSYAAANVAFGGTCQSVERTCLATGQFDAEIIPQCQVASGASCSYNGQSVAHGGSVSGFLPQTSSNRTCTAVTRTCNNGVIVGEIVPTCSVKPVKQPRERCRIKKGKRVCKIKD